MSIGVTVIGPQDHGRRMSLEEFDHAEGTPGHLYELSRGVITVMDVPDFPHMVQVGFTRDQFILYKVNYPGRINQVLGGAECKILVGDFESERHPDVAVYKNPPRKKKESWYTWVPELVVEVVSPGSEQRDYEEKREEYLSFGIKEYWILDQHRQEMLVLRRVRGKWKEQLIKPGEIYETLLFPGLPFDCCQVFQAAAEV